MSKTVRFILMGAVCALIAVAVPAGQNLVYAGVTGSGSGSKPIIWTWWPQHWDNLDFKPYIENPTQSHNSQWNKENWKPADWAAQRGGDGMKVISGFYKAGILNRQFIDDDIPVLEVGPAFYMLGGYDKRRVMETIDSEFQITSGKLNGMFMIRDWSTQKDIGSYTVHGLQLQ